MSRLARTLLPALAIFCLAQLRLTVFATNGKWKTSHVQIRLPPSIHNFGILRLTLCLLAKTFEFIGNDVAKFFLQLQFSHETSVSSYRLTS